MISPSILNGRNNKLHAQIWRLTRQKDPNVSQAINKMRSEIKDNNRKIREIEYLKRADGQLWRQTISYIKRLYQNGQAETATWHPATSRGAHDTSRTQ